MYYRQSLIALLLLALGLAGCGDAPGDTLFERLGPERTGITFVNELSEGAGFNIIDYPYYYNGGGVAVGDVTGNGLPDLFFTANEGPNRLYLNQGDFRFEDATDVAGVAGQGNWTTGVTMVDVNGNGLLDLYVMNVGAYRDRRGRNELYVNEGLGPDGLPRFSERAAEYGLDFEGYATHAVFFDYDGDGLLDVYLLNHSTHTENTYRRAEQVRERHERAGDRLLRNVGTADRPRFVDVSEEAGILSGGAGYGLSVVVADFNDSGWPDLYVANDFHENDYLYLNNGDGTFTESIATAMPHTSHFSMGSDAADLTGDGRPDLLVVDMLPRDEAILKTSVSSIPYTLYELQRRLGYEHQLARNTLQINRGPGPDGVPRFSDAAFLTETHATDWSWAALLADFDLDGRRDLFVSTGIYRRPNDLDYINYVSNDAVQVALSEGSEGNVEILRRMPQVHIPNAAFRNRSEGGALGFEDVAEAWGLADLGFSNGAVYADLNNDGALDLVVNRINAPATVYRNHARARTGRQFLRVVLEGEGGNTLGIGARVTVAADGRRQVADQVLTRGYLSSVDPRLHFGLGTAGRVDSLTVRWPDGRTQTLRDLPAGQTVTLRQSDARPAAPAPRPALQPFLRDITEETGLDFLHQENAFLDFNRERLMPHRLSTEGPALAVGDVTGNGLDDVFLGGAKYQPGQLFLQGMDGRFTAAEIPAFAADSLAEDVDAVFFDANGDGHLDLYVVSGGNEYWGEAEPLRDRLYLGDGRGGFTRAPDALPALFASGGVVAVTDLTGDGYPDLFVGSRSTPRQYGVTPRSALLVSDGAGRFRDATDELAPGLAEAGMVSGAVWADVTGNGHDDLVVVGEWMAPRVFENRGGRLAEVATGLEEATGWWNTVTAADLTGDGRLDLVLGNLGLNSKVRARDGEPARLHLGDFGNTGSLTPILTTHRGGREYPVAAIDLIRQEFEEVRRRYTSYASYGARPIGELVGALHTGAERVLEARTFASALAVNTGDGFSLRALPDVAQLAPVYAAHAADLTGDGALDLLLAGNFYGVRPDRGRYDASYGVLLRGDGAGGFRPVELAEMGALLDGEVRAVRPLRLAGGRHALIVARNDARPLIVEVSASAEAAP